MIGVHSNGNIYFFSRWMQFQSNSISRGFILSLELGRTEIYFHASDGCLGMEVRRFNSDYRYSIVLELLVLFNHAKKF